MHLESKQGEFIKGFEDLMMLASDSLIYKNKFNTHLSKTACEITWSLQLRVHQYFFLSIKFLVHNVTFKLLHKLPPGYISNLIYGQFPHALDMLKFMKFSLNRTGSFPLSCLWTNHFLYTEWPSPLFFFYDSFPYWLRYSCNTPPSNPDIHLS